MNFDNLLVPPQRPLHVSIAGLIGVGKSTLAQALAPMLSAELIKEPVEENPFLAEFYEEISDPNHAKPMRSAYPLQMALLQQRFVAVSAHLHSGKALVNDRSPYEDSIFVKMLQTSGDMSQEQARSYMEMVNACFSLIPEPSVIVWLKASPETCFQRIQVRGRELERSMSLDYLQHLNAAYEDFFTAMRGRIPILIIDREHASPPGSPEYENEVLDIVNKITHFRAEAQKKLYKD